VPVEVDINLIADQDDDIEDLEKVSRKKSKKKQALDIKPIVNQYDRYNNSI